MSALQILKASEPEFFHYLDLHGLGPILAERGSENAVCRTLASALRQRLIAREFWEEQHRRVVTAALRALMEAAARPLLFKGTALAWSCYPRPATRVRGDSDILIADDKRLAASQALLAAGFVQSPTGGGSTLFGESLFQGRDTTGRLHDIDLHWRLNNARTISRPWSHAELWERSVPLDALMPGARRISNLDALLIASVHRRLHLRGWSETEVNGVRHATPDSLTWILDLDLLMREMPDGDLAELEGRARAKGVGRILAAGLEDAHDRLGTPLPEGLTDRLAAAPCSAPDRYLHAGPIRQLAMDFVATNSPTMKVRFIRELLFPSPDYMRARFADWPRAPLAALYLRRLIGGLGDALVRGRLAR